MSEIRYRLAKPSDAKEIADVHWHVRDRYTQGIFLSLGKGFLKSYFKVILDDPWEVVVCAVNENGRIVGFASSTLDVTIQTKNLRKHRFSLGTSALWAIIKKPSLLKDVWQRYQSLRGDSDAPSFIHTSGGARGEYWCWLKGDDSLKAVELNRALNEVLYDLGVREKYLEVDKFNEAVYNYHVKINKAVPIEEITLPDGRVRVLMRNEIKRK